MLKLLKLLASPFNPAGKKGWQRKLSWATFAGLWVAFGVIGYLMYVSKEPEVFDPIDQATFYAASHGMDPTATSFPPGYLTVVTYRHIVDTLLYKRGGYITNDRVCPTIMLDNVPNWEDGVLMQVRDFVDLIRRSTAVNTTTGQIQKELDMMNSNFNIDPRAWFMPSAEGAYADGIKELDTFLTNLTKKQGLRFFPRAEILGFWLDRVFNRLVAISQELTESAQGGQDIGFSDIDDTFYRSRGETWAIYHLMKAIRVDFDGELKNTGTAAIADQILVELSYTQMPLKSPMVLNGYKFGLFANHNMALANYISRIKVMILDMNNLLMP